MSSARTSISVASLADAVVVPLVKLATGKEIDAQTAGAIVATALVLWHAIEVAAPWCWKQFREYWPPKAPRPVSPTT